MTRKKTVKQRAKRKTVTFEPEPDLIPLLDEIDEKGRRIRSLIINRTLRRGLSESLQEWTRFRGTDQVAAPAH